MRYALVKDGNVVEYRDYDTPPESRLEDGAPLLRPVVNGATPPYDPDIQRLVERVVVHDTQVSILQDVVDIPIAELRDEARRRIKEARDRAEKQGFEYIGHRFESDLVSALRITAAATAAIAAKAAGQSFFITWTDADNNPVVLDAGGVIGLHASLVAHANSVHIKARSDKDSLDKLTAKELAHVGADD